MNKPTPGFKAHNPDLSCRNFQFTVGQTYVHDGAVQPCESGFHFCTSPLDVLNYYSPTARFTRVTGTDCVARKGDSKQAARVLRVDKEISLRELIEEAAKAGGLAATSNYAHAATTGDSAHAATAGDSAHAATTGTNCVAVAVGARGQTKGALGNMLILVEWRFEKPYKTHSGLVDGKRIKPDVFYEVRNGGLARVK